MWNGRPAIRHTPRSARERTNLSWVSLARYTPGLIGAAQQSAIVHAMTTADSARALLFGRL